MGDRGPAGRPGRHSGAKPIFTGFSIGLLYKTAMAAFKTWREIPEKVFGAPFKVGSSSAEISPEFLGVGYIIGPRIASIMCAGGVLGYLVLIPAIKFLGVGYIIRPPIRCVAGRLLRRTPRVLTSVTHMLATPGVPPALPGWQ